MIDLFKEVKPDECAFDTETDGLHIKLCRPFFVGFGFKGHSFTWDLTTQPHMNKFVIEAMYACAKRSEKFVGWNVKYDLHMMRNAGFEYPYDNITDGMIYARLAHDAKTVKEGGISLGLKDYASRFIDLNAKYMESQLKDEKTFIIARMTAQLKYRTGLTKKAMEEYFKDSLFTPDDLPEGIRQGYYEWLEHDVPKEMQGRFHGLPSADDIPYTILNRDVVEKYLHYDIIYTLESYWKSKEVALARGQQAALAIEEQVILPLYRMESVGFQMNKEYIKQAEQQVRDYLLQRRQDFKDLAGCEVTSSQNKIILDILQSKFQLPIKSTGRDVLSLEVAKLREQDPNSPALQFISTLQELRTLEKWYSTYVLRLVREAELGDRIYTTVNQCGAVSGRVSSDFQQFPKNALKDKDGNEIFSPRRMIKVSDDFEYIAYLDYSQIELRVQALYTILVMGGDLNMCRAYMPFKCISNVTEELFDDCNTDHIKRWNTGEWYLLEDRSQHWEPVDVHGATTQSAFPELVVGSPEFKKMRSKGKATNFAKNYGASKFALISQFGFSEELATKLDAGYNSAFPGVVDYRHYVDHLLRHKPFAQNLFGRRYYGSNAHLCCNYLVQGSSADFLKSKMIQLDKYLQDGGYKSRFQMNIHDECSFEIAPGEAHILHDLKKIMEDFPGARVPIVADLELTTTTWADKYEVDIEEVPHES